MLFRRSLFALTALALLASCGLAQTKPAAKEKAQTNRRNSTI